MLSASLNCYIGSKIPASLSFCFIEQLPLTNMDFTSMNYLHVNVSVWLQWLKSEMFLMDCHLIRWTLRWGCSDSWRQHSKLWFSPWSIATKKYTMPMKGQKDWATSGCQESLTLPGKNISLSPPPQSLRNKWF